MYGVQCTYHQCLSAVLTKSCCNSSNRVKNNLLTGSFVLELSQAELGQLGVGDQPKTTADTGQKEKAGNGDWESELQEELQRFGVEGLNDDDDEMGHQGKDDETWEAEIEQMLEMDKEGGDSN